MTALHSFRRRLARRLIEPVNVTVVGTSTVFGTGAPDAASGFVARLGQILRGRLGYPTGGLHLLPTHPGWTRTGTWAQPNADLGEASMSLTNGATMAATATCTGFRILFRQGSSVATTFTVTIDAGTAQTVTVQNGSSSSYDGTWESGPLTRGPHTVKITAPATGTCEIGSVYAYDGDETTGVRTWCGGVPGVTSARFSDTGYAGAVSHWRRIGSLAPAALVLMLSGNDYASQTDPAVFEANVRRVIALYRLTHPLPDAPVLLVHTYLRPGTGTPAHGWVDYGAALAHVAADTPAVDLFSVGSHWPTSQVDDVDDLLSSDNVHPTPAGHAWLAELVADRLIGDGIDYPSTPAPVDPTPLAQVVDPALVARWRASDLTAADGAAVGTWTPGAGSDLTPLTQTVSGRQPVLRANALAGRPVLTFTQPTAPYSTTGQCMATTAWTEPVLGPVTVAAVLRLRRPYGNAWSGISTTALSMLILGGELTMGMMAGTSSNGGYAIVGLNGWIGVVAVYDGLSSRLHQTRWATQHVPIPDHSAAGLTGLTLAGNNSGANTGNLDVAEFAVYRRALTENESDALLAELATTYGLTAA